MCDFDDGDYMGDDSFEDDFTDDMELDSFEGTESDESDPGDSGDDDFTAKDAFFIGSIAGNAYEEGLEERRRLRKLTKSKSDKSSI